MDVQYQIIKSSRSSQKQIVVSISGCPTFLLLFFLKQLLFSTGTFSQLRTCKTHTLISFNLHTSLPGHHFECSQSWIQSCRHDVSHRDFFLPQHTTYFCEHLIHHHLPLLKKYTDTNVIQFIISYEQC